MAQQVDPRIFQTALLQVAEATQAFGKAAQSASSAAAAAASSPAAGGSGGQVRPQTFVAGQSLSISPQCLIFRIKNKINGILETGCGS